MLGNSNRPIGRVESFKLLVVSFGYGLKAETFNQKARLHEFLNAVVCVLNLSNTGDSRLF
jgi:hypothetical protein